MDAYVELRSHRQTLLEKTGMEVNSLSKSIKRRMWNEKGDPEYY